MTRMEKMQAVVDAAREWVMPSYSASVIHARDMALRQALAALDALDADAEAQEMVTLGLWVCEGDGSVAWFVAGSEDDKTEARDWRRLGTVTLPVSRERGA